MLIKVTWDSMVVGRGDEVGSLNHGVEIFKHESHEHLGESFGWVSRGALLSTAIDRES